MAAPVRVRDDDQGSVTVEAALAVSSLVAVMAVVVAAVAGAVAQLRCMDAAREAARLVARGEPDRARQVVAVIAPREALLRLQVSGDEVAAEVSAAAVPGLPGLSLSARAIGVLEPAALVTSGTEPTGTEPAGTEPAGTEPGSPP